MMTVLVLGGCGFIGSHLVDALLRHGVGVRVFDRQAERFRPPVHGVEYRFGNFSDRMSLVEAMTGVDVVIHLISTTFPGTADLDPRTDVKDNLIGTLNLLDSMVSLGIKRIVYFSSGGTVYGVPDRVPIPESHALRPINSYGIVKAAIENYLEMYRRTRGISPLILRPSNPYGPRQGHAQAEGDAGGGDIARRAARRLEQGSHGEGRNAGRRDRAHAAPPPLSLSPGCRPRAGFWARRLAQRAPSRGDCRLL